MTKLTLAGHPLYPQLAVLPLGALCVSAAMDTLHMVSGRPRFGAAGLYSLVCAAGLEMAAGVAGACMYVEIPARTTEKQLANMHALLGASVMAFHVRYAAQRLRQRTTATGNCVRSLVGYGGALVAAWYGAHLIFEHGVLVKGQGRIRVYPGQVALPGDERVSAVLERAVHYVPAMGPARVL